MFYGRIAELDGNIGDRMGGILQQQPGCRHFGFKFFLEKCLSVLLLKQALRLPLTSAKSGRKLFQRKIPVFIQKTFFDNQVVAVRQRGFR